MSIDKKQHAVTGEAKRGHRCMPWYDEKGEIVGFMMVSVDLEEEKKKAKQKATTDGYDNEPYSLY